MNQPTRIGTVLRPFVLPLYLPSLCNAIMMGAQNLIIPLYLNEIGFSIEQIGLAVGAFFFGMMLWELPSGILLNRFRLKSIMFAGVILMAVSSIALIAVTALVPFVALRLVAGMGMAMFTLSRHTFVTVRSENESRGSVLSWVGGTARIGRVFGPLAAGTLATALGLTSGFWLMGCMAGICALCIALFVPREATPMKTVRHKTLDDLGTVLRDHWRILTVAGIGQFFMQLIRAAPRTIIPLFGESLGLAYNLIGLVETIGGILDTSFFWTAGPIMDRFGRKFAIVPSIIMQSIGLILIPFTGGFITLALANSLIGLGNSISSGTMMTLASDLAPADTRNAFLSLFRLSSDFGISAAPNLVGLIAGLFTLATSGVAIGLLGFVGAVMFIWFIPETLAKKS